MRLIASAALFVSAAFAQNAEYRVFTFAHLQEERQFQEFVNAVRVLGDTQRVAVDAGGRTLAVTGSPDQIALTEWLLDSLDQAAPPQAFTVRETSFADPRQPMVKVCFPVHLGNPQAVQETVNAVRSIGEVQRVVAFSAGPAVLVRATPEGAALAEWLMREADGAAAGGLDRSTRDYRFDDPRFPVERRAPAVRIYYPANIRTPIAMQETVNILRKMLEIQRVVVFSFGAAVVLRGTEQQAAAADWLMAQLDGKSGAGASQAFGDQVVRTFFLPGRRTGQELADAVKVVRTSTGMQRVTAFTATRAVIVRGTAEQVGEAERILRE